MRKGIPITLTAADRFRLEAIVRDRTLPVARVMAMVPWPSAVSTTIRARQTCFCGLSHRLQAGRIATPTSVSPVVTKRHNPISSLRAMATISDLRVP